MAFSLATVISFCNIFACNVLHLWTSTCQVSLCLCKNVVYCYWNQSKPSQLKNCLVLVDIENTIECLGKKCKMIIKIILFAVLPFKVTKNIKLSMLQFKINYLTSSTLATNFSRPKLLTVTLVMYVNRGRPSSICLGNVSISTPSGTFLPFGGTTWYMRYMVSLHTLPLATSRHHSIAPGILDGNSTFP